MNLKLLKWLVTMFAIVHAVNYYEACYSIQDGGSTWTRTRNKGLEVPRDILFTIDPEVSLSFQSVKSDLIAGMFEKPVNSGGPRRSNQSLRSLELVGGVGFEPTTGWI